MRAPRWIPYSSADATSLVSEGSAQLVDDSSLPEAVLARAPSSFDALLEQAAMNLTTDPRLDFMRGKTVILAGDRCATSGDVPCLDSGNASRLNSSAYPARAQSRPQEH